MKNSPALIQRRARRGMTLVAAPFAAFFIAACAYSIAYYAWYVPALGNGQRASETYLVRLREGDLTRALSKHRTEDSATTARALWTDLTRKHGRVRDYRRNFSQVTTAPLMRTRQDCGYDITFADGEHVFVHMELVPRRFASTEWAVAVVVAPPLPKNMPRPAPPVLPGGRGEARR